MVYSVFDRGNQPMLTDRSTGKGYYIPRTLPGPGPNMRPPRMNYPTGGLYGTRNDYPPVSRTAAVQNTSPVQLQSAARGYGDAGGHGATNAAASRDAYNCLGGGAAAPPREGYGSRGYSAAALGDPMTFAGTSRRAVLLQDLYGQEPRAGYGDQQQQQQSQYGGRQQTGYGTGATQYGGGSGQQYGGVNGGFYGSQHGAGYGGGYGERSGGEYGGGGDGGGGSR